MSNSVSKLLLTTNDVAERLFGSDTKHHRELVGMLIRDGALAARQISPKGRHYVTEKALQDYIDSDDQAGVA